MSLSSKSTFLCDGASAGDFRKSGFFHEWIFKQFSHFLLSFAFWYPISWYFLLQFLHGADFKHITFVVIFFCKCYDVVFWKVEVFMVTEVYYDEWCYGVRFPIFEVCYHQDMCKCWGLHLAKVHLESLLL